LHLVKKGHKVTVISGARSYHAASSEKRYPKTWYHRESIDGIDVIWVDPLFPYHRSFFLRLLSFITFVILATWAGVRLSPDMVYVTSPPLTVIVPGYIMSRLKRAKLIFEVRDLWPESAITTGILHNTFLIKVAELLEKFAYHASHAIVTVSQGIHDTLIERGIDAQKLFTVPHGADLEYLYPTGRGGSFRQDYDLHKNFVAIYAGSFGWANGLEILIESANILQHYDKNIHIVLLGDGKEKSALTALTEKYQLKNITFATPVPKKDIALAVGSADVGLMILRDSPTFSTVLPNKLLGYMACELPVIINFSGYASSIVEQAQAGLVIRPGNPQAICDALLTLSQDPILCKAMGQAGRKYIIEHYSRKATVQRFEQVLQMVGEG
jgi:glycosyltransferase involved in cell wall biosynthesis